ncbi:OmpA/MotB family protein [Henriciella litoralis]|uniref:OmpA/MotB family protein n=1 Tax=Henriciella litoralis TaxID=568102 RepID=UPI00146BC423|nr:OmpA family protein [Henriciella litoralis]
MPLAPTRRTGAWKLAYADFLTALCALFLVLWLVHGATSEQKESVAEGFGGKAVNTVQAMSLTPSPRDQLSSKIQSTPLFSDETESVTLQTTKEGVRINLLDPERAPLFEKGDATLNTHGESLIALTAAALAVIDYPVSIEGHTDSDPINRANYSNWDLSSERANAARRALVANGLDATRIRSVAGLADTQPLDPDATNLPQNRRLSIVIHIE